jgi:hypothetical protein
MGLGSSKLLSLSMLVYFIFSVRLKHASLPSEQHEVVLELGSGSHFSMEFMDCISFREHSSAVKLEGFGCISSPFVVSYSFSSRETVRRALDRVLYFFHNSYNLGIIGENTVHSNMPKIGHVISYT